MFDFMKPKTLHARVENISEITPSFIDNFLRWYMDKSRFFTFDSNIDGSIAFVDSDGNMIYMLSTVDYYNDDIGGGNVTLELHHTGTNSNNILDTYVYYIDTNDQKIRYTLYYSMGPTIGSRYNVMNMELSKLTSSDDLFHIIKDFFSHCILKMAMYIEKQKEGDLLYETIPDFTKW